MSEAAPLLAVLRRVQRRVRVWSALEGAVIGGAAGLLLAAGALAMARVRQTAPGAALLAVLVGGSALLAAIGRAVRRIPLARCARLVDAALDRKDRVLSALSFAAEPAPSPLVRALIADAVARASPLPVAGAAPARRPRGLLGLAAGAGALAIAAAFPIRSGAAVPRVAVAPGRTQPVARPLAAGALDVERQEMERAAEAAAVLGNERVTALAAELQRGLRGLAEGRLDDGQMLDLLKSIEAQAAEAARAAERDARALEASQRALAGEKATRAAAESLTAKDPNAADQAADQTRAALGASAESQPKETGRALADAARGVAASVGRSGGGENERAEAEREKRRLTREGQQAANEQNGQRADRQDEDERRLERLQRDLEETARDCQAGDPRCREDAQKRADDLSRLARRAAAGESLRRLERAARQMRGRLGRGDLRDEGETRALRQFERGAKGQPGARGEGNGGKEGAREGEREGGEMALGEGEERGDANGAAAGGEGADEGQEGQGGTERGQAGEPDQPGKGRSGDGKGAAGEAAARTLQRVGVGSGASAGGDGVGDQAGGNPLGRKGTLEARGRATEAEVASGAGPNRAEVIGGAATEGFVTRGYARVFADYEAAVEEALGATAVPEGKRYIVRRYFDLIRPREGTKKRP